MSDDLILATRREIDRMIRIHLARLPRGFRRVYVKAWGISPDPGTVIFEPDNPGQIEDSCGILGHHGRAMRENDVMTKDLTRNFKYARYVIVRR